MRKAPPTPKLATAKPSARSTASTPRSRRVNPDEVACRQFMVSSSWREAYAACARAGDAGSTVAQSDLASLFQRGDGVRRSDDSAARWFGVAARGGSSAAMYQLGIAYEHGRGLRKDEAAALDWYTRAADGGDALAQLALGAIWEKGHLGVRRDKAKALEWYRKSAAQGNEVAARKVRDLGR